MHILTLPLLRLGFVINAEKSALLATQKKKKIFLGLFLDSRLSAE